MFSSILYMGSPSATFFAISSRLFAIFVNNLTQLTSPSAQFSEMVTGGIEMDNLDIKTLKEIGEEKGISIGGLAIAVTPELELSSQRKVRNASNVG